jgi:hypothetical protein
LKFDNNEASFGELRERNSLPNFYFRYCGFELGKRDVMGTPVSL